MGNIQGGATPNRKKGRQRAPKAPVRWLSIKELIASGRQAGRATKYAKFADARPTQVSGPAHFYDFSAMLGRYSRAFTVDYVADTGDGFDATWAIARSLDGSTQTGPVDRANLLILGGDLVYPLASVRNYNERLEFPYEEASANSETSGFVAALPGNHDWYDGLVAFRRNFCESYLLTARAERPPDFSLVVPSMAAGAGERMVGRRCFQARSYFATKLPGGWWLWAVDAQLDAFIDAPQLEYFAHAKRHMDPTDQVVLMFPRPSWVDNPELDRGDFTSNRETMRWFVDRFFSDDLTQVRAIIAGDRHHYLRHELVGDQPAPQHLITCGGGGAYLSSTHHAEPKLTLDWQVRNELPTAVDYQISAHRFPSARQSRKLKWGFWKIPTGNGVTLPSLFAALGALPVLGTFLAQRGAESLGAWLTGGALGGLALGLITLAVVLRPDRVTGLKAGVVGAVHAGVQSASALGIASLIEQFGADQVGNLAMASGAAANLWLALYFVIADWLPRGWRLHENELFAGMAISDFKSHLRFTIAERGANSSLEVEVFTISRVPAVSWIPRWQRPDPVVTSLEKFELSRTVGGD